MPDTLDKGQQPDQAPNESRKPEAAEVLRARPVKGEIDHRAVTREIMARFPKILAALAK
jgi:hypothetical protein